MNIVIAIDSFKGSLTSIQAGEAAAEGIKRVLPNTNTIVLPIADGGEGTTDALINGLGGTKQKTSASDPLNRKVICEYGIIESTKTAIIEIACAAGLTLLSENERNPMETTTYGVGEVIRDAIKKGCRKFIIGIGGSATNDGGTGMLQALGFGIYDKNNNTIPLGAKGLEKISKITSDHVLPELKECEFNIACDVTNPLCGKSGCSEVYALQKGADKKMIKQMDKWLENYAAVTKKLYPAADKNTQGAGAAGGLGFAFSAFLNGKLTKGIDLILNETHMEDYVKNADIVITGEGKLDSQIAMGKTPAGVAKIAKKYKKPVIAFAGSITKEAAICHEHGIDAYFTILRNVCTLEDAMNIKNAYNNMADTAEQVFRLIKINKDFLS